MLWSGLGVVGLVRARSNCLTLLRCPCHELAKLNKEIKYSKDFSRGGGGVILCQNEGIHQIFMSFSPLPVGCLLKKWLTKWGLPTPKTPPPPRLCPWSTNRHVKYISFVPDESDNFFVFC